VKDIVPPDPCAEIAMDKNDSLLTFGVEFDIVDSLAVGKQDKLLLEGHY
jgi:hypothetical protein